MLETLISAFINGVLPLGMAVYIWPYAKSFRRKTKLMADFFYSALGMAFYYSVLLVALYGVINVGLAAITSAFPIVIIPSLIESVAPSLLITAVFLFARILVSNPEADHSLSRNATVAFVVAAVALLIGGAVWQGQRRQIAAPFIYDSVELLIDEYCPGDQLEIEFSGWSDQSGRDFIVGGFLTNVETGQRFFYDDLFIPASAPGEPQYFPSVLYTDRTIPPDLPTGGTTYHHSNRSANGSSSDSFTTKVFSVNNCSQSSTPAPTPTPGVIVGKSYGYLLDNCSLFTADYPHPVACDEAWESIKIGDVWP